MITKETIFEEFKIAKQKDIAKSIAMVIDCRVIMLIFWVISFAKELEW